MNTFNFRNQTLRTIELDGQPWFVAADVCRILGINMQTRGEPNVAVACRKLAADESTLYPIQGTHRSARYVTESGLYKLVMRSDKAEAVEFQNWVTREVLPSIRKTGGQGSHRQAPFRAPTASLRPLPVLTPAPDTGSPLHGRNNHHHSG